MQNIQVVYPGCQEILPFPGRLEALEHVVSQGQQGCFMIKQSESEPWEDGSKLFKAFQTMFEPANDNGKEYILSQRKW